MVVGSRLPLVCGALQEDTSLGVALDRDKAGQVMRGVQATRWQARDIVRETGVGVGVLDEVGEQVLGQGRVGLRVTRM